MENSSNILFSSVRGAPSFVHSPHTPNTAKINSCSYYLSILDPNIDLPELSSTDIDELLADSSYNKSTKDSNNFVNCNNTSSHITELNSFPLNINSQMENFTNSDNVNTKDSNSLVNFNSPCDGILFKCIVKSCMKNFPNKGSQMEHFYTDHKEKVITCTLCKSIFKSKYSLHNHILMNPACKIKNSYRCVKKDCDKYFFSKNNLETHLSQHHNIPSISCLSSSCFIKFIDIKSRNDHVKTEHCEITYYCSKCNKIFLDLHAYEKHNLKLHQETPSRLSYSMKYYVCPVEGCEKYFSTLLNLQHHQSQHQKPELTVTTVDKFCDTNISSHSNHSVSIAESIQENIVKEFQILYACPLSECSETLVDKEAFRSHFVKHCIGELPGDINSLLPPDPYVSDLELHNKTFEANVDSFYQREETNLVQALDLVPDKLWESLELLNDEYDSLSPNCGLTSALILPSTDSASNRNLLKSQSSNSNRRRKNPYHKDKGSIDYSESEGNHSNMLGKKRFVEIEKLQDTSSKLKCVEGNNSSLSYSLLSSAGLCARTCPKINLVMANLIKRRRVFLKERIGMMESCDSVLYQPEARQPALKQVVRQIFNSQQLPNKYEEIVNVDNADL